MTLLYAQSNEVRTVISDCAPCAWITVKIGKSMIIRGNAATRAAILIVVQVGSVLNSASTGTSEYLCILNSITQLITIPVIPQKKEFYSLT
jgi:hypothetical protein